MTTSATAAVDAALREVMELLPEPGAAGCRRIVEAGGKRLRPELVVLVAETVGGSNLSTAAAGRAAALAAAAAAVELLHTATLLHDDLIDDSENRRGVPTVHRSIGPSAAVVTGDALIGHSWRLIARTDLAGVTDLAVALQDMCLGEADEELLRRDPTAGLLAVLRVSSRKTGALLKAACRIGARLGGADEREVDAFGRFGADFGIALQLIDDVLDVVSEPAILGKPCAADFRAGTLTLPAVWAISESVDESNRLSPAERAELRVHLLADLTDTEAERVQTLILRSGSPARTVAVARAFARRAVRALGPKFATSAPAQLPGQYVEHQLATKTAPRHRHLFDAGDPVENFAAGAWLLDAVG